MLKSIAKLKWLAAGIAGCAFATMAAGSANNSGYIATMAVRAEPFLPRDPRADFQEPQTPAPNNSPTAAAQPHGEPFPFSHKRHAEMRFECSYCHEDSQTGTRAGFPAAHKCMMCHVQVAKDTEPIKRLAALPADTRIVPEKPLYKLPDFVFFSHARHKSAGIECAACHGDVWTEDVVALKLPMRMKACVDCHRENKAAIACTTCHEAFQQ